ncbi:hypothetical protein [Tengunoibacter tsumagoiensis]|uniref:Uncharacterized protein n=1 Tax=Tengunoibacter tsumagoiensis TaxID=2014871 RepID=A0A401ZY95_9CHLR|nr:hypothetical protein [Tengunoibacter tsumagoiensis]GCE11803.1 hypothetical protein KTT_16620 [Tengunoibacter tsumagoiensis]
MSDHLTLQGRQRARVLMRYYAALEAGDIDELAAILQEAEYDDDLQTLLLEANEPYLQEHRQAVQLHEIVQIQNLVQQQVVSTVAPTEHESLFSASRMRTFWQHCWLILVSQWRLIHKSIWIVCLLALGISGAIAWYLMGLSSQLISGAEIELALLLSVTTASGIAYLCGGEQDVGQEIVLSTPTSPALIVCCRTVLVVGYNILLAFILSFILSVTYGISLIEMTQIWLGPILLLSALAMAVTVILGSLYALCAVLLIEVGQMLQIRFSASTVLVEHNYLWQTNTITLLLACACFLFALFYVSRHPRSGPEIV